MQKASIHQSHWLWTDQNFRKSIWKESPKEHSCEIISKSDQRFRQRKPLIHQCHVYGRIKILRTIFEKGHARNIPVNLFQNLTRGFRDFLKNFSCLYSARSLHSPEQCLMTDQNFAKQFMKRVIQGTFLWNHFKIGPAVSEKKIF